MFCYFGHPKSASTYFGKIMLRFGVELGFKHFYKQITLPGSLEKINSNYFDLVISQNSSYSKVNSIKHDFKAFHLIRDPRDICVSAYFSYLKTHDIDNWTELADLRKTLSKKSIDEGLYDVIDFNHQFFEHMGTWDFGDERILELRFENYILNPSKTIFNIMMFFDLVKERSTLLDEIVIFYNRLVFKLFRSSTLAIRIKKLSKSRIEKIIEELSFKNITKDREIGEENVNSHYRKGIQGDWKKFLKEEHLSYFRSKHPDLLSKLNYE